MFPFIHLLVLSPVFVNFWSTFCYCRLVCTFWSFFCKWTHPVITFLEGYVFFHCLFHDSSLSLHISAVYFFLLIDGIPLCRCTICLSHSLFDGHLIISSLGLLQIKMLQTFMNKSLYEQMLLSLLGKYLGMKWLDHMVRISLIFKKLPNCFSKLLFHFTFPPALLESSSCSTPSPIFVIVHLYNFRHSNRCVVINVFGLL